MHGTRPGLAVWTEEDAGSGTYPEILLRQFLRGKKHATPLHP